MSVSVGSSVRPNVRIPETSHRGSSGGGKFNSFGRAKVKTPAQNGQCIVIVVGREDVLADMVRNNRQTMRYTGLSERLRREAL